MSTIYLPSTEPAPLDLEGWKAGGEAEEKIGTLIACRKRQQYGMLCEADLDSGDRDGRRARSRTGLGSSVKGSPRMLAFRPTIHGGPSRMEEFTIKKANPPSKRV
jgi:hypothetical protein